MIHFGPNTYSATLPAPVGGWNARDSLAEMDELDAWLMDNVFPGTTSVQVRKGFTQYSTGIGGEVESLLTYNNVSGTQKLFAVGGNSIFDSSSSGAVGAAAVTGLTNSRWQHINITNTSGTTFLMTVNGSDKLRGYDGSAWYADGDGTHDITGVDTAACIGISLHKQRVFLLQKNTLDVWYLAANAISGAANKFSLASIAKKGGYVVAVDTWTIDAGYGVDDLWVAVTSEGEIIVYRGTDISSSTTWALVGVWELGAPLGRRCLHKYAGDLLILSQDGLLPLAAALQSSRLNPKVALSNKIQSAMSTAATLYATNFGWQAIYYPQANMLIVNVPVLTNDSQQQYVMNTITKAWCRWKGINANCWAVVNNLLYFGGCGFVGKAWNGAADNATAISADVAQAYSAFKAPGQYKHFTRARPILLTNGAPTVLMNMNLDFNDVPLSSTLPTLSIPWALWDTALWDAGLWGSDYATVAQWQGLNGIGYYGSPRMSLSSSTISIQWVSTDLLMRRGEGV